MEPNLTPDERKRRTQALVAVAILERLVLDVLTELPDDHFVPFRVIAAETGLGEELIRAVLRQLRGAGLVIYQAGLWTDNGEPAGAGYAASRKVRFRRLSLTMNEGRVAT